MDKENRCPSCKAILRDSSVFCTDCGKKLFPDEFKVYICPRCNTSINLQDKFCNNCGNILFDETGSTTAAFRYECDYCQTTIDPGDKACKNCGKSFTPQIEHVREKISIPKVILIGGGIILLLIMFFFSESKQKKTQTTSQYTPPSQTEYYEDKIEFCTHVDDSLNCIGNSNVFSPGTIYAMVSYSPSYKLTTLYIKLLKLKGRLEYTYDEKAYSVDPDHNIFAIPIIFYEPGDYKVKVRKINMQNIVEGFVSIR